eukprot:1403286-Amphidinium_carterae.2
MVLMAMSLLGVEEQPVEVIAAASLEPALVSVWAQTINNHQLNAAQNCASALSLESGRSGADDVERIAQRGRSIWSHMHGAVWDKAGKARQGEWRSASKSAQEGITHKSYTG